MEPILTYSEITGRVYIVTKYKRLDGGVIDTREKFDVTEWVESYAKMHNAQIVKENAKLREYVTKLEQANIVLSSDNTDLLNDMQDMQFFIAENRKLRELVRDMWCCISHIGEYDIFYYDMAEDGCGMSCTVNGEHCCADKLHDRMRELGIEVSDD